jgi:hypothetical protein
MFIRELFEDKPQFSDEDKLRITIRSAADALNIRTANIDSAEFKQGKLVAIKLKDGGSIPVPPDWDKKWVKNSETDRWEKTGTNEPKSQTANEPKKDPSLWDRLTTKSEK